MAVITTTVYLGLNETAPQFKNIVAADKIQKEEFEDFSNMEFAIKNVYKNEFKNNETLAGFKNVLFEDAGDSLYFVRLNSKNGDYALVYKDSNGNYTIDYIIKEFRMIK
jgi:predicted acetyltransferase